MADQESITPPPSPRPPLNVPALWQQVAAMNQVCLKVCAGKDPNQPQQTTAVADERYHKLMATVLGPNDDPLGTDWH